MQCYFISSTSEWFVSKDVEEISDITTVEKVNGEKCIDSKNRMSPKIHDQGDNKIPSRILNPVKNGHTFRRQIDTSCINENEDIGNNFRSEVLLCFINQNLFSCVKCAKKMC